MRVGTDHDWAACETCEAHEEGRHASAWARWHSDAGHKVTLNVCLS